MYKPVTRWFLLALLGIASFCLGLIRYDYVLNVIDFSRPFLLPREIAEQSPYPTQLSSLSKSLFRDPRWLSAFIYMIYPAISTCVAVYLIFKNKNYVKLTVWMYIAGLVLPLVFIIYSIVFNDYKHGYSIAQYVKMIYQEPYVSLLLLASFYLDNKNRTGKEHEK